VLAESTKVALPATPLSRSDRRQWKNPYGAGLFERESDFEGVNQLTAIHLGETYLEIMTCDDSHRRKLMKKKCE
jgi:hypothetical protein